MNRVFVIRGFNTKTDSAGNEVDFEHIHTQLIKPALDQCGLTGGTTEIIKDTGNIRTDMFELIIQADLVICDITVHNANVFYELGVRHSLRKKHTVMIKGSPSADSTPFDLATDKYMGYSIADPQLSVKDLVSRIQATLHSQRETDSPVFLLLPSLSEADPSEITAVPIDLVEEIERAEAVSGAAWLRVIVQDLEGERFERDALQRIGISQWNIKDMHGTLSTWEKIRNKDPEHFTANRILANAYERLYRKTNNQEHLELSNQAIRTLLDSDECSIAQRAEALALKGRNKKTLWRSPIASAVDVSQACIAAIDTKAIDAYHSYKEAFMCDLNDFYPGLAMLQMGFVLKALADHPRWGNLFHGNSRDANRFREDLHFDLPAFTHVVTTAIERAQSDSERNEPEWADVAKVDLLFLTLPDDDADNNSAMLIPAYQNAIPRHKRFVWDATRGQLDLFRQLGIKAQEASAVISHFEEPAAAEPLEHLVVFAGYTPDTDTVNSRFPANCESKARQLIFEEIMSLQKETREEEKLTVLASAAPGADILAHEVCKELDITTCLCLPMPSETVAQEVFKEADSWRERFMNVLNDNQNSYLQMSALDGLPRWLQGRDDIDPWERGNRWVIELAKTWNASRTTLLVFWNGQDSDGTGGTAQLVRLAKASGQFTSVRQINTARLQE
ncbi:MAG: tetratricopeptide repeat-containing protein [Granulosicoccus sp.]